MAALIVKMTDGTDIRRHTARADQMTFASLHKKVAEAFPMNGTPFKIQYKDDEGDEITMTCDEELAEAISLALKLEPAVLRLRVVKTGGKPEAAGAQTQTQVPPVAGAQTQTHAPLPLADPLAQLMANISQQLPALVQQLPEAVRSMIPNAELDIDATVAATKAATGAAAAAACSAANAASTFAHSAAGATNNAAAAAAAALASGLEGFHPGVTCDRSGLCPIVGNRYNLKGHDYDLCEEEYSKLREGEKELYQMVPPPRHRCRRSPAGAAVHHGVSCDKSGVCPIVGTRYHLPGRNYDLCQAEFDKLPMVDQAMFQRIERPCKFGMPMPHHRMNAAARAKCPLAARFVQDLSIHDGTQMAPNTKFTKIWRLKNVGDVPWPQGTKLLRVGGDAIGAPESVPISPDHAAVAPGAEVDVAVDMTAPADIGRYVGYWRLTGPWGRRKFGQRVWCHVQVVDPASPPQPPTEGEIKSLLAEPRGEATDDDEEGSTIGTEEGSMDVEKSGPAGLGDEEKLAETLQSMGFTDRKLVASVIRKVGLDVDACAHELVSLSEYDTMLSDLEEMGFNDRERNQQLLVENSGSIKKTVKSLIADPSA